MKRNLFDELKEGIGALQAEREGKLTLRAHTVEKNQQHPLASRVVKPA